MRIHFPIIHISNLLTKLPISFMSFLPIRGMINHIFIKVNPLITNRILVVNSPPLILASYNLPNIHMCARESILPKDDLISSAGRKSNAGNIRTPRKRTSANRLDTCRQIDNCYG